MNQLKTVANPPNKPILIIDGTCSFCQRWGGRLKEWTGISYLPYQEIGHHYQEIPIDEFKKAVQLISADGEVYSGAAAVYKMLSYRSNLKWMYWLYCRMPIFNFISNKIYAFISHHRHIF